jgi:hypothetical protein
MLNVHIGATLPSVGKMPRFRLDVSASARALKQTLLYSSTDGKRQYLIGGRDFKLTKTSIYGMKSWPKPNTSAQKQFFNRTNFADGPAHSCTLS